MAEPSILYDLTEFVGRPHRTGIQRVSFETAWHWPGPWPLVPVALGADGRLHRLPPSVFPLMAQYFGQETGNAKKAEARLLSLGCSTNSRPTIDIEGTQALLNTEVFFEPSRVDFYERLLETSLADRIYFVLYDLLPWLHPEHFASGAILATMPYVRMIQRLRHVSFISAATRRAYHRRLLRRSAGEGLTQAGPVLPLGSDALGCREPVFRRECRRFVVVGTLEPRKGHLAVLEAFESLWDAGVDVELLFVGRLGWLDSDGARRIEQARRQRPGFRWLESLDDAAVADAIHGSRASIYPSWVEGFGLPPLESLALGVPVIVSATIPSVEELPPLGQVRLDEPSAEEIRRGVLSLLDDDIAAQKHEEIRRLRLPRWCELGQTVARWLEAGLGQEKESERCSRA